MFSEYKKHAQELTKNYDLSNIDGIVILSGDGMISEVINNIIMCSCMTSSQLIKISQSDWSTAMQ